MKNSIYLFIRIFLCSLAGIFISQVSFAQHWEWAKGITGTDGGYAVTTDHFANVYVTGRFSGSTFTFGLQTFTNRGNFTDIYVAKFDSSGSILWVKSAGSNDMDVSKAIATDTSGNVYVAGTFESQMMVFGTDTLRNPVGDPRIFILKYDAAGNELHGFCESSGSSDDPSGIACDKSGNLYLTGELMTSDITFGSMTVHNIAVGQDVFLFKFDGNGTPLWAAGIRGDNYDFSTGLAVDKDANVIVSGYFKSDTLWIEWRYRRSK